MQDIFPQRLKAAIDFASYGTAEEFAEEVVEGERSIPQALKRQSISNDLAARLKSCPSRNQLNPEFFSKL
ncbi:MAG: hypothetical protein ACLP0H_18615 [Terriglobales bacterium]